jgi:hypothetical protein
LSQRVRPEVAGPVINSAKPTVKLRSQWVSRTLNPSYDLSNGNTHATAKPHENGFAALGKIRTVYSLTSRARSGSTAARRH